MKIGYQGIEGSNSEAVALEFATKLDCEYSLIPLTNSNNVTSALQNNEIDYGVMATYNILGGVVKETEIALKGKDFKLIKTIKIPIHHCIFKKKNISTSKINVIASHEQALKQTIKSRKKLFPNSKPLAVEDTALAAKYLSQNIFEDNIAVICRKNAGEMFNLELLYENIEDDSSNYTEFGIYKKIPSHK